MRLYGLQQLGLKCLLFQLRTCSSNGDFMDVIKKNYKEDGIPLAQFFFTRQKLLIYINLLEFYSHVRRTVFNAYD